MNFIGRFRVPIPTKPEAGLLFRKVLILMIEEYCRVFAPHGVPEILPLATMLFPNGAII